MQAKERFRCIKILSFVTVDFPCSSTLARGVYYFMLMSIMSSILVCICSSFAMFQ